MYCVYVYVSVCMSLSVCKCLYGVLSVLCVGVCVCEWGQSCHSMFPGVRGQFSGLIFYLIKTESQISGHFCCTWDTRLAKLQAGDQFSFLCLPSQDGSVAITDMNRLIQLSVWAPGIDHRLSAREAILPPCHLLSPVSPLRTHICPRPLRGTMAKIRY